MVYYYIIPIDKHSTFFFWASNHTILKYVFYVHLLTNTILTDQVTALI